MGRKDDGLKRIEERERRWLDEVLAKRKDGRDRFVNLSEREIKALYTPLDVEGSDYLGRLGFPGEYPFTRGVHPNMYRGRLWTMRQFSGFGNAHETNERYRYLLDQGQTGLSVAFDYPTLYGYDTDQPESRGEFGKCGVAVSSLEDMQVLFDRIDLGKVTTSMTINGPAAVIWGFYILTAESQGVDARTIGGTIQNDILKEYIAQKSWIFPPEPSMRLIVDTFEYGMKHTPNWNPISISGYHIREAGSTAVQELAFTLADGLAYARAGVDRGLDIDAFAPRLSFFFNAHNDFFEEIAKYRAARRIWAREMRETFGARKPRSWWLRFHTQTAGVSLTAQQPFNNVVRVTMQALAAVLGGTQSLHTNSLDEALALPSEMAVTIALRTQQIIACESGVTHTADPLGGSYYVEWLTDRMEEDAYRYFDRIETLGGVIPAIESGFFQREIAEASYRQTRAIDDRERIVVSVNEYLSGERSDIPILMVDEESERRQAERLRRYRGDRDAEAVQNRLADLRRAAEGDANMMEPIMAAARAHATLGEICSVLRDAFGEYREPPIY
ncbi:MAG: methylmalonyl-CoA mutase family protein [Thermoplasmata archaeon]|nr:methylmalonyl-CoA mutase family protein [Thermoplasmata archaeon]